MAQKIDTAQFKQLVYNYEANEAWKFEGDLPVIVDFYADWCGPCKMVAPILEELSKEYAGKLNIYKVNTDEEQEISSIFGIQSIPSILFVPKNEEPKMQVGALPKPALLKAIKEVLKVE